MSAVDAIPSPPAGYQWHFDTAHGANFLGLYVEGVVEAPGGHAAYETEDENTFLLAFPVVRDRRCNSTRRLPKVAARILRDFAKWERREELLKQAVGDIELAVTVANFR